MRWNQTRRSEKCQQAIEKQRDSLERSIRAPFSSEIISHVATTARILSTHRKHINRPR